MADIQEPANCELLVETNDPIEADMLKALLKQEEIPVIDRLNGAGGALKVLMGDAATSLCGIRIYVAKDDHAHAKELIDAYLSGEAVEDDEIPDDIAEE